MSWLGLVADDPMDGEIFEAACDCLPLVCDLPGVLAAWDTTGCVAHAMALGAADGLYGAPRRHVVADMGAVTEREAS